MILEFKEFEPIGTNSYFIVNELSNEALLVDAPLGSYNWAYELSKRNGFKIKALFLTHGHWDHILDAYMFKDNGIKVYGHIKDEILFEQPEVMSNFLPLNLNLKGIKIDQWINKEIEIDLCGFKFKIYEVPGHCPGSVLFYLKGMSLAFVGDAIFFNGIGRCDLPGGDFNELRSSIIKKIYSLPDSTLLYPGHGPKTSVFEEKKNNPFVKI